MVEKRNVTYRGSSAPMAMTCPGSVHAADEELLIDSANAAATVGTALHAVARAMVDQFGIPDIDSIIKPFGLTTAQASEVYGLTFAAWDFWKTYGPEFGGGVETEAELKHEDLSAHLDVLSMPFNDGEPEDLAHILDFKTTRLDINYTPQLLFYSWLVCLKFPKIRRVKTVIVFLRDRTADIKEWTRAQIEEFGAEFDRTVRKWDGRSFTPGGHCGYCRRFANCPAHAEMVRHTIDALIGFPSAVPATESTRIIEMYQQVGAVSKLIETFKDHVKSAVEHAGGEIQGANGQNLKLIPSSRDKINAALAWPFLTPVLTREELAECTEIKKTAMLKAVAANAPRGTKGTAKEAMMERLKEAGAVETSAFNMLRVVQANTETKEIDE